MEHVKKREEISKEFTWALEDLYQDQAEMCIRDRR